MSNLEDAFKKIEKTYGRGTIRYLKDSEPISENLLSTGSLLIDSALGGGIGYGRIIELYGVESSGKSTLCLHLAAECQKTGGKVAYVDVEQACDLDYAKKLGVNVDELIFTQPSSAEQALEIVDILAKTGEINLIIVDSVAALCPQAELDGEMSDMTIGLLARLMSKALRKITATLNQSNCAVVFVNQIREKISTGWAPMGDTTTTTGGRALKFFASQRIELKKTQAIKNGDEVIGAKVRVKIVKNKISAPMKVVEVPMIFGKGFDASSEVLDLALQYDICKKSGAWFTTHDGVRAQGRSGIEKYYNEHPDKYEELRNIIVSKIKNKEVVAETVFEVDPTTGEVI